MQVKAAPKLKRTFKLVKWDGDAPPDWRQIDKPEQNPKCLEVVEWELGNIAKTTYKRDGE